MSRGAELSFPESVVGLLKGRLGRPPYGFPEALRAAVLKGEEPLDDRPGAYLAPTDLEQARAEVTELTASDPLAGSPGDREALSLTLFPDVYREYVKHRAAYGDTSVLDTLTFFYGLEPGERVSVEIEPGKTLIIRLLSIGRERADGTRPVRFELNGHSREVRVQDAGIRPDVVARPKADPAEWREVGASMPGRVVQVLVEPGESVEKGAQLLMVEAMKMETAVTAPRHAVVETVAVSTGEEVEAGDLLVRLATVPETGGDIGVRPPSAGSWSTPRGTRPAPTGPPAANTSAVSTARTTPSAAAAPKSNARSCERISTEIGRDR